MPGSDEFLRFDRMFVPLSYRSHITARYSSVTCRSVTNFLISQRCLSILITALDPLGPIEKVVANPRPASHRRRTLFGHGAIYNDLRTRSKQSDLAEAGL